MLHNRSNVSVLRKTIIITIQKHKTTFEKILVIWLQKYTFELQTFKNVMSVHLRNSSTPVASTRNLKEGFV